MYNYLYKFHLLKPASANSQVTLVTCSGAFINTRFRKVWFYSLKHLLLLANVSKTPVPQPPTLAAGCHPAGTLGGAFRAVLRICCSLGAFFSTRCASPRVFLSFFSPTPTLPRFFYLSGGPGTPPDTKKPSKSLYCRRFSRVRRIRESALPRPLWGAIGITFGIILGVVGLLGALLVPPLKPNGCQHRQKSKKTEM